MGDLKAIHQFALKYFKLYQDPETKEIDVDRTFADECFQLGFKMDAGKVFIRTFSEKAFYDEQALYEILQSIQDPGILGDGIFSKWRYITPWGHDDLTSETNRAWFVTAFSKLVLLTAEGYMPFLFYGKLKKLQLTSNSICYGPCPEPDDEVEQRIIISWDGRVWFSRYLYGTDRDGYTLLERKQFRSRPKDSMAIMEAFGTYFGNDYEIHDATDVGIWELALTNFEGRVFKASGSLSEDLMTKDGGLSDILRERTGLKELYAFHRLEVAP